VYTSDPIDIALPGCGGIQLMGYRLHVRHDTVRGDGAWSVYD
jgi:hypothetical protein